jgi:hypothetical protein
MRTSDFHFHAAQTTIHGVQKQEQICKRRTMSRWEAKTLIADCGRVSEVLLM